MPRQKSQALQPHPLDHIDDEKLQADFEVLGKLGPEKMRQESLDAAARSFLAGRISGSVQAGRRMAKLNEQVSTLELAGFKEQKLYKGVIVPGEDGGTTTINTWEQYCDLVLGISKTTADEQILNLKALGEEVFTLFEEIGLAKSLVTNFRRIPELERDKLLEDLRKHTGDADYIEDVVRAAVDRRDIDEARLRDKTKELEQEVESRDRIIEDKDKKINEYELEKRGPAPSITQEAAKLVGKISESSIAICGMLADFEDRVADLLVEKLSGQTHETAQAAYFDICAQVGELCEWLEKIRASQGFSVWMEPVGNLPQVETEPEPSPEEEEPADDDPGGNVSRFRRPGAGHD